jgi:hypothetical protein
MCLLGMDDVKVVDFRIRIDVDHSLFPQKEWVALFKKIQPKVHIKPW